MVSFKNADIEKVVRVNKLIWEVETMYEILNQNKRGLKNFKLYSLINEIKDEVDFDVTDTGVDLTNISDDVIIHSMISHWDNVLCIGIGNIDNKHKELFNLINKLVNVMKEKESKHAILRVFNTFEQYVITHFNEEEAIQKQNKYPGYVIQHNEHEEFKSQLKELKDVIENTEVSILFVIQMQQNMFTWFRKHIMNLDRKFGTFLIKERRGL